MAGQIAKWRRRDFEKVALMLLGLGVVKSLSPTDAQAAPPATTPNGPFKSAANQFAANFLKSISKDQPQGNQFLSPYSIESALLMTMEGAKGQTAAEMGSALALPTALKSADSSTPWQLASLRQDLQAIVKRFSSKDPATEANVLKSLDQKRAQLAKLNSEAKSLQQKGQFNAAEKPGKLARQLADEINKLSKTVDQYELQSASGLWIEKTFELRQAYLDLMRDSYEAAIEAVDFKNSAEAERIKINAWVSDRTRQKINNVIPEQGILNDTRMVLANAIYFRGTWQNSFEPSRTKPLPFYNSADKATTVQMMSMLSDKGRYAAFNADGTVFETPSTLPEEVDESTGYPNQGFQLIELGYNGDELDMWVALPTQRSGLPKLIETLSSENFDLWERSLKPRKVELSLPRFKLELNYDLRKHLAALGMPTAFDSSAADFSGMSEESLYISKVIHKTFVEVNEKGTEAAAATVVMMTPTSARPAKPFVPKFVAEHPFLFLIRHRSSGVILFIGTVQQL